MKRIRDWYRLLERWKVRGWALSASSAAMAYAWSLAVVESIVQAGGMERRQPIARSQCGSAPSTEDAVRDTLHSDYSDLQQQTIAYLRHEDVR